MKIQFDHNSQTYSLDLVLTGKTVVVTLNDKNYTVEILSADNGNLDIRLSGSESVRAFAFVSSDGAKRWVTVHGQTWVLTKSSSGRKSSGHGGHAVGELVAPMPGQVRAVKVAEGESVTKGQTLVIVEAMKMEIKVAAPRDGKVKSLKVQPGQIVEREQTLVEIE